jgi:molybdate transport system substrate-binding protein
LLPVAAACRDSDSEGQPNGESEIVVFAASSLTEAFKELGTAFAKANPGTQVTFNFAASSALATQINEGAPADVFASADTAQMKVVTDRRNALEPAVFAKNTPVVVVPKSGSPVATFDELAKEGIKLVLAAKDVPIGRYAREILAKASATGGVSPDFSAKVLSNLKSDEANVRGVLTKVQLGEADAGIVYGTDVGAAAGEVRAIQIPAQYNVIAEYPIAVISGPNVEEGEAFVAFVRSSEGLAILEKHGFAKP